MGRINRNVKIWNFNLGDFYTVITRPHRFELGAPNFFLYPYRGIGFLSTVGVHPGTARRVHHGRTSVRAWRTGGARVSRSDHIAKCTKNYCKVCAICHYTSIARCAILYTSSRAKDTAGDPAGKRGKNGKYYHAQDHDRPL